ncbi:MAG TPA: DMT family transporter [Devosiaceae bacterium]|jgi:drug/metabolite transporter (DMT)-like permease|nr:DMT family transporter [Devosiaceae bacterium]
MPSRSIFEDRRVVFASATLCCLLWGSAFPAIKGGYALLEIAPSDIASQMLFAGYRFTLAGLALLLYAGWTGRSLWPGAGQTRQLLLLGATQTGLQYVFFYIGLAHATGVKGSIMSSTSTFFSVLLAHFIYAEDRLGPRRIAGCALGFAGVVVVNVAGAGAGLDLDFRLMGEGFLVIAAFIVAAASIYGKRVSQRLDAAVMTGYQLAIGGLLLCLLGFVLGGDVGDLDLQSGSLLAYLAFLSAVAFGLWSTLLKYNPVGMVAIFNFLIPVFGVLLSALLLGENMLEWKNLVALCLVATGIWLVTWSRARAAAPVS